MHPESLLVCKGLPGFGYGHGSHFNGAIIHEGYQINIVGEMDNEDSLTLTINFLDPKENLHFSCDISAVFESLSFISGYIVAKGRCLTQNADLIEQMPGVKRSGKGGNAEAPAAKRRAGSRAPGKKTSGKLPISTAVDIYLYSAYLQG